MKLIRNLTLAALAAYVLCWLVGKGYQKGLQEGIAHERRRIYDDRIEKDREIKAEMDRLEAEEAAHVVMDQYLTFDHQGERPPFSFQHTGAAVAAAFRAESEKQTAEWSRLYGK